MKKYLVILGALLMVAGSAFAQGTVLNQDSCDISVSPAATLLLPYFSVDPAGETTLVTITNVSDTPAVAHFTVWTNLSYPVLDFNIWLTGYDVQGISLTDLLVNGSVPNTGAPTSLSPRGTRSRGTLAVSNTGNPNSQGGNFANTCDNAAGQGGTGIIPPGLLAAIQTALTGGSYFTCAAGTVSRPTATMVGYITIDVIDICSQSLPTVGTAYFQDQMLRDNQLIGDYIRINAAGGVSGASPLVHIKAVPAGGPSPGGVATTFNGTFYDRYQRVNNLNGVANVLDRQFDNRQPLPSQFAARYLTPGNPLNFNTDFTVWRQGITNAANSTNCASALLGPRANLTTYVEIVRFDERENPTTRVGGVCVISPCDPAVFDELPETSLVNITATIIPPPSATPNGWLYWNLANGTADVQANYGPTQAWVQVRMTAAGMFGVDFDAAYLANGCSSLRGITAVGGADGGPQIKIGPHIN